MLRLSQDSTLLRRSKDQAAASQNDDDDIDISDFDIESKVNKLMPSSSSKLHKKSMMENEYSFDSNDRIMGRKFRLL